MDGVLNIDKPSGKTSYDIVAMVKRLTGFRRVGHAGTLDPLATGVLPVCFGRATRIVEFLAESAKVYRAQIELGVVTDTYDAEGKVMERGDYSGVGWQELESALGSFRGVIQQTPPMYSAVKHHGKPLYRLARAGLDVERKSRPATIHRLELLGWEPPAAIVEVECGKGTYIRALAHDLGRSLGCGASLKSLVRLRYGLFDIKDAMSTVQLNDAFHYGYWQHFVYPADYVLLHWSAMIVSSDDCRAIMNGRPIECGEQEDFPPGDYCRAYTPDGCFLGVLRFDSENRQWRPEKVLIAR